MISLALSVRHARLLAVARALDGGANGGLLQIYAAPRPASGGATEATLLVEVRLPLPCWSEVQNGQLRFAPIADALARRSGEPAWARLTDGDGRFVADVDAGPPGSTAELQIAPTPLLTGGRVQVSLAELTEL